MPDDIRLSLSFKTHRKRKKLFMRLGADGVLALLDFWMTIAETKPTGVLENYTGEDVEIDAGWNGEPGIFVSALIELGFLDIMEGGFVLHNWDIRQPWVFNSEGRSDKCRFSRMAMTHPEIYERLKKDGVTSISKRKYVRLTSAQGNANDSLTIRSTNKPIRSTPAPAPDPNPVPTPIVNKKTKAKKDPFLEHLKSKIIEENLQPYQDKLIEFYHYRMAKPKRDRYESVKGPNGLIRNLNGCVQRGMDGDTCLEIAMEEGWKTPNPDYYKPGHFQRGVNNSAPTSRSERNAQACKEFANE